MKKITSIAAFCFLYLSASAQYYPGSAAADRAADRAINHGLDKADESSRKHYGDNAVYNSEFIPGSQVVFADNFEADKLSDVPRRWHLGSGQAEVNTVMGKRAMLLTAGNYAHVSPMMKQNTYLTDNFTIEFDSYSDGGYGPKIYFYSNTKDALNASNDKADIDICNGNNWEGAAVSNSGKGISLTSEYPASLGLERYSRRWHHVAIAYNHGQVKVYVDQYRVIVAPDLGVAPKALDIEGIGDMEHPVVIGNVRIANM